MSSNSQPISVTPRGLLQGIITSFAFGISVVVNKAGLDRSSLAPLDYTALSALVAGVLALPFVITGARRIISCSGICHLKIAVIGISASGFAYLLLFWGQSLTRATNAAFMLTLTAFFTVVFAAILLGERIDKHKYPVIGLLFVGLYFLTVGTQALKFNVGDLFIAGTALIWGITNSIARSVMREISALIVAWLRLVIGAAFLMLVLRVGFDDAISALADGDLWFLASGVLVWASIVLFYRTIEMLGAGMASLMVVSSPVLATAGAVLFLGEVLSTEDLIGGGLILISLIGITSNSHPSRGRK